MSTIRQLKSGKWQVQIRKKNYPEICRSFLSKGLASKWSKMVETQMDKRVFEDLSGAEGTTLKALLVKYRDELVPTFKSAKTLTYKINYMLKFKVCYYNLLQLNSGHINKFKKEISDGRAPKTINAYIDTLKRVWDLAAKKNATKTIHAQTLKYISAEVMKCSLGESHIMGTYQCKYIYPLNMYSAANINAHIGSAGAVLSDKNPYDAASYAVKQPTTAFVLGQVSLSATVVSPYMINLHTCIKEPCNTDANKMIDSVRIE